MGAPVDQANPSLAVETIGDPRFLWPLFVLLLRGTDLGLPKGCRNICFCQSPTPTGLNQLFQQLAPLHFCVTPYGQTIT